MTPTLRMGGSLRMRYENKRHFAFGAAKASNKQDYWLQQLRIHLRWQPSAHVALYLEGQDARLFHAFGSNAVNRHTTPNIYEDHFDLHQAYLDITVGGQAVHSRMRLGRQKLNLGTQRMVASLEWVNTARVWDGVRMTTHIGSQQILDLFSTRLVPVNPTAANNHQTTRSRMFNSSFHGIYYTNHNLLLADTQWELYALLRRETKVNDRIFTWGSRFDYQPMLWHSDGEVMLQSGTYGGLQQRAYALHLGVGRKIPAWHNDISAAYNLGSGDNNNKDNRHQTFDNLYPLNHSYYGYMDFFSLQNMQNIEVVSQNKLADTWLLRMAWQGFWLNKASSDNWYNAGAGVAHVAFAGAPSKVGDEIDVTLKHRFKAIATTATLGYSHFFTGSYIRATGNNHNADFGFLQVKTIF
ncbi:MAG: alginate export family protein [Mariprofundales bacterium]